MKPEELRSHRDAIRCAAIQFYKAKGTMFPGQRPYDRWRQCIRLVADIYLRLGPQCEVSGPAILL
ncbi:MAG: hypothetical protein EOP85_17570 [Verrucomicrobiaceae bacterium]|nr:MAG: hypothetical protein EOP85_17570 [Verrucomicrobiaceae bacterium]